VPNTCLLCRWYPLNPPKVVPFYPAANIGLLLGDGYNDLGLICAKEDGNIWKPDTMTSDFGDLTDRAGLTGVRLHDMRHSHATQLLLQGVNPKIVSERLGHSTVGITLDIYSHILPGMQEQAAMKFDSAERPFRSNGHRSRRELPKLDVCRMFANREMGDAIPELDARILLKMAEEEGFEPPRAFRL